MQCSINDKKNVQLPQQVGIITRLHNNINYGGVLQAYALLHTIHELGYEGMQIQFLARNSSSNHLKSEIKHCRQARSPKRLQIQYGLQFAKKILSFAKNSVIKSILYPIYLKDLLNMRCKYFDQFCNKYISSTKLYTSSTLPSCLDAFNIFICGSDLIWYPNFPPEYALSFVPDTKLKVAYAPSIGLTSLTEGEIEHLKMLIPYLDAISVREIDGVNLLKSITSKRVEWVLDPCFLLTDDEWNKLICPYPLPRSYVLCYILGRACKNIMFSKKFAKIKNLLMVTLPVVSSSNYNSLFYGDIKIYDAGPDHFISLIKNADYVITDSFHGTVFSILFRKKFYVLQRYKDSDRDSKNSRVNSLLYLFHLEDRLIKNPETFDWNTESEIDYDAVYRILEEEREKSLAYLKNSLNLKPKGETKE